MDEIGQLSDVDGVAGAHHDVIGEGAVSIALDFRLEDDNVVEIQVIREPVPEADGVPGGELEAAGNQGVASHGEVVHDQLGTCKNEGGQDADEVHAGAHRQSDAGGGPDAGSRSQSPDGTAVLEDDAGPQEADAADGLGRNAGGVSAPYAAVEDSGGIGHVHEGVLGDDHGEGGGTADNDMGADSGLLEPFGPFDADDGSTEAGDNEAEDEVHVLDCGELCVHVLSKGHGAAPFQYRSGRCSRGSRR